MFGGLISQVQVLKDGMPEVESKFFVPQRETGIMNPSQMYVAGTGVYGEIVSASPTLFDAGYFFFA